MNIATFSLYLFLFLTVVVGLSVGLVMQIWRWLKKNRIADGLSFLAATRTLPPEYSPNYSFTLRRGLQRMGLVVALLLGMALLALIFLPIEDSAVVAVFSGVIAVYPLALLVVFFLNRHKRIAFTDTSLMVEGCARRPDSAEKGLTVELPWTDIAQVDYVFPTPYLVTTDGVRYEIDTRLFLYGAFSWVRSFHPIEIWLRIDYYHRLYGGHLSPDERDRLVDEAQSPQVLKRANRESTIILIVVLAVVLWRVLSKVLH